MENIFTDDSMCLKWRFPIWDELAFGKKPLEILELKYGEIDQLNDIFNKIEEIIQIQKIDLVYFRFNSDDKNIKKHALQNNFHVVEHSYSMYHPNINKLNLKNVRLEFRRPVEDDIDIIKQIAKESFQFGRFHEDPFIASELASLRYENWISQLINDTNFFVFEVKGQIAGFFNYTIKNGIVDLPLSGLSSEYSGLGGYMWNDMFTYIREIKSCKKAKIVISASNIAVLNLYINLGFKVVESKFGYHKHIIR